jgi:hypothetical protein
VPRERRLRLAIVFWSFSRHLVKTGEAYQEKGVSYLSQLDTESQQQHLVRRLERLGYQVTLQPQATLA